MNKSSSTLGSLLSLLGSLGTLVCCVLPAVFVSLGAGATLASLLSAFPQLIFLSEHKIWVFAISGALIAFSALYQYTQRNAPCPIDPIQAKACTSLRTMNRILLIISAIIWLVGFFFAFMAAKLFF